MCLKIRPFLHLVFETCLLVQFIEQKYVVPLHLENCIIQGISHGIVNILTIVLGPQNYNILINNTEIEGVKDNFFLFFTIFSLLFNILVLRNDTEGTTYTLLEE